MTNLTRFPVTEFTKTLYKKNVDQASRIQCIANKLSDFDHDSRKELIEWLKDRPALMTGVYRFLEKQNPPKTYLLELTLNDRQSISKDFINDTEKQINSNLKKEEKTAMSDSDFENYLKTMVVTTITVTDKPSPTQQQAECSNSTSPSVKQNPSVPNGYTLKDVIGDGNCFYRAVFHALSMSNQMPPKYHGKNENDFVENLRSDVAKALKDKSVEMTETMLLSISKGSYEQKCSGVLDTIQTYGEWRDEFGDVAVAVVKQYLENIGARIDILVSGQAFNGDGPAVWTNGNHYQTLVKKIKA